MIPGPAG